MRILEFIKRIFYKKPHNFKKGEIYKMAVASRSYVKTPYFVIINDVGKNFIETCIPEHHSLKIDYPSGTWDYQIPRMTLVTKEEDKKLLYNQSNLLKESL